MIPPQCAHDPGADRDVRARRAGRLQRVDDLAPDRFELAFARITELDFHRERRAGGLDALYRARRDEVLAGVRIDEFREYRLYIGFIERHARSVS